MQADTQRPRYFTPEEQWPAPGQEAKPALPATNELVLYSVRITEADRLSIKEATYWIPGLTEQDLIQAAVREKIASLGDAVKPLPPHVLSRVGKKSKH